LTFGSLVLSPTGSINLGFTTEGKLAAVLIITFSWGFPTSFLVSNTYQRNSNQYFGWGNEYSVKKVYNLLGDTH
jgi:hypothetical protein